MKHTIVLVLLLCFGMFLAVAPSASAVTQCAPINAPACVTVEPQGSCTGAWIATGDDNSGSQSGVCSYGDDQSWIGTCNWNEHEWNEEPEYGCSGIGTGNGAVVHCHDQPFADCRKVPYQGILTEVLGEVFEAVGDVIEEPVNIPPESRCTPEVATIQACYYYSPSVYGDEYAVIISSGDDTRGSDFRVTVGCAPDGSCIRSCNDRWDEHSNDGSCPIWI